MAETAFWTNSHDENCLQRTSIAQEIVNETAYRRTIVQHQGKTEAVLTCELKKRGVSVSRPYELVHYEYQDHSSPPLCAFIKTRTSGQVEKWHYKYLIAADGKRGRTRELSGIGCSINDTDASWAVGDFEAETKFPDLRRRCPIRTTHGNLMLIPSPDNTVRIYMLLDQGEIRDLNDSISEGPPDTSCRRQSNQTTLPDLFQRKMPVIFNPYTIKINKIRWISRYVVSQRVAERFYDGRRLLLSEIAAIPTLQK